MNLKMIVALVADEKTDDVVEAARAAGATGATVVTGVRGEGLEREKTFLGLDLTAQRDMCLFLVVQPKARDILETIAKAGRFEEEPGSGIVFQLSVEDAIGLSSQKAKLIEEIEETL